MRLLCLAAASLGSTAAFIVPSSSIHVLRTDVSLQQHQQHQHQHRRTAAVTAAVVSSTPLRTRYRALSAARDSADGATRTVEEHVDSEGVVGVIVCDHGSRRENANEMLFDVAKRYQSFAGVDIVEAAHMELAEPSIEQAFDRCVDAGADKIILHPFFLSPGRHVTSDIPALMKAAALRHPQVAWVVSEPLGLQELMPRVMHAAVSESAEIGAWQYGDGNEGSRGL